MDVAIPIEPDPPIPGLLDLLSERALPTVQPPASASPSAAASVGRAVASPEPDDPFAEERARTGERSLTGALRLRPDRGVVVRREWVEIEV
ncbi:MAG TPA: hypothetical protein VH440_08770 [Candidatus Limnocylindrales bacterium]